VFKGSKSDIALRLLTNFGTPYNANKSVKANLG
jgi:hypothetical protein